MMGPIINVITHRPDLAGTAPRPLPPLEPAQVAEIAAARTSPGAFVGDGPKLWGELHRLALKRPNQDAIAWLWGSFATQLPCGHCRADWLRMLQETPPDLRSSAKFFRWTVDRHNEVNSRLGKPVVSLQAAQDRWISPKAARARKNA